MIDDQELGEIQKNPEDAHDFEKEGGRTRLQVYAEK